MAGSPPQYEIPSGRLTVLGGPNEGAAFDCTEELVHVGAGRENHWRLEDPELAEYHASFARRGDRFAVYTPLDRTVQLDGQELPADRWVWLPPVATIRLSKETVVEFAMTAGGATSATPPGQSDERPIELNAPTPPSPTRRRGRKAKRNRQVARFVSDGADDLRVRLGEDGELPELRLIDSSKRPSNRSQTERSPYLLYAALAFSFVATIALLLVDPTRQSKTTVSKEDARTRIEKFYGDEPLRDFQRMLRAARLAASLGDREREQQLYMQVLDRLYAEDVDPRRGITVTGTRSGDEELIELISVLLAD